MIVKVNSTTFPLPHGHAFGVRVDSSNRWHTGFVLGYDPEAPKTEDQKNIQKIQRFLGVSEKYGGVDGYFKEKTGEYVKAWQRENNMPVTGYVDQATWEAMGLE
jgi:hypothetical protein